MKKTLIIGGVVLALVVVIILCVIFAAVALFPDIKSSAPYWNIRRARIAIAICSSILISRRSPRRRRRQRQR